MIDDTCTPDIEPAPLEPEYIFQINDPSTSEFILDLDAAIIDCSFTVDAIFGTPGTGHITYTNEGIWYNHE